MLGFIKLGPSFPFGRVGILSVMTENNLPRSRVSQLIWRFLYEVRGGFFFGMSKTWPNPIHKNSLCQKSPDAKFGIQKTYPKKHIPSQVGPLFEMR